MEITVKKTIEEKVKLELPAYFTNCAFVYKISLDESCMQVCTIEDSLGIQKCFNTLPLNTSTEPTTKEFYDQEFKRVLELILIENQK
jgi:hypothetical protein